MAAAGHDLRLQPGAAAQRGLRHGVGVLPHPAAGHRAGGGGRGGGHPHRLRGDRQFLVPVGGVLHLSDDLHQLLRGAGGGQRRCRRQGVDQHRRQDLPVLGAGEDRLYPHLRKAPGRAAQGQQAGPPPPRDAAGLPRPGAHAPVRDAGRHGGGHRVFRHFPGYEPLRGHQAAVFCRPGGHRAGGAAPAVDVRDEGLPEGPVHHGVQPGGPHSADGGRLPAVPGAHFHRQRQAGRDGAV